MLNKIKLGIVVPASGIYRTMGKDFQNGIKLGIGEENIQHFELVSEFIGQGRPQQVEDALQKLESFHGVDLFTGILSSKTALSIQDFINRSAKPFIINNLGEQLLLPSQFHSPYLFLNDFGLCQSEYAMGKWFTRQGVQNVSIAFSLYEGGYHLYQSFRHGAMSEGMLDVFLHQLPLIPGQVDSQPVIDELQNQQASHIHSIFCGVDGQDFLKKVQGLNFSQLTTSPFLVEDDITQGVEKYTSRLLNAATWAASIDSEQNIAFVSRYQKHFNKSPNPFSLLGYETGLALKGALEQSDEVNATDLQAFFKQKTFEGPRGTFTLTTDLDKAAPAVYLRRPEIQKDGTVKNVIIEQLETVKKNHPDLIQIAEESVFSWQNPYLCI